jgi:hypothetical protein
MIEEYLLEHGFDGLFNGDGECGCVLDDLVPCGELNAECEAGYKGACDCGEGCGWHIGRERAGESHGAPV